VVVGLAPHWEILFTTILGQIFDQISDLSFFNFWSKFCCFSEMTGLVVALDVMYIHSEQFFYDGSQRAALWK
jgi:hypothetical protein